MWNIIIIVDYIPWIVGRACCSLLRMTRDYQIIQQTLSQNIRALRTKAGFSQEELALRADVDRTYVSQIERALGNPSLLVLSKLAVVLNVDVTQLLASAK